MKNSNKLSDEDLRRLAEEKLNEKDTKDIITQPVKDVDPLRLLHELQVHQVELEMQNEQLQQSQAEVAAGLKHYTDLYNELYDFAPVGYLTLNRNGIIQRANLTAVRLLGVERSKLVKQRFGEFVSSESRLAFTEFLEKVFANHGKEIFETALLKDGHDLFWAHLEATVEDDPRENKKCRIVLVDITASKQVEIELQRHKEDLELMNKELAQSRVELQAALHQYSDLYDFAPVGYFTLNRNGMILQANLAGARLLGLEHELLNQQFFMSFVSIGSRPAFNVFFEKLLTGQGKEVCELELQKGADKTIWASIDASTFEGGGESRMVLVDITERKKAEELLRASEIKFRTLAENNPSVIYQCKNDARYTFLYLNNVIEELTGYPAQAFLEDGLSFLDLYHPDDLQKIKIPLQTQQPEINRHSFHITYRIRHKSGAWRWVDEWGAGVLNEQGVVQYLEGVLIDITERKQAEEALIASKEFANNLIASIQDGVSVLDTNGVHMDANPALCRMTGFSHAELVGSGTPHPYWPPEEYENIQAAFQKTLAGQAGSFELIFMRKNGERFPIIINPSAVKDRQGTIICYTATVKDITERKKMEDALRESQELLALFMHYSPIYAFIKSVTASESRVLQASENYQNMLGVSGLDMIGKTMPELFPADLAAKITADDWSVVTGGEVLKVDEELHGRNYTSIKFPITQRNKTLLAGYSMDVTEQVQAEAALQESELFIKDVLNSLTAHIAVLDQQGVIIAVNEAWIKFGLEHNSLSPTGFTGSNYLAACITAIEQGDLIAQQVEQGIRAVLAGSLPQFSIEYPLNSPTQELWFTVTVLPQHKPRQGAIVMHQNITERKQAEKELEALNGELQIAFVREQELAQSDSLTGINNRRHLYELAEHEFGIATRYQQPLSVIMFDIDHFKKVNDTFGHAAGDQILQLVTQAACNELRSTDVIGRYGGEEFVIILPMTNAQQAYPLAERIRAGVAAIQVPTEKGQATVTLSIGIMEMPQNAKARSVEDLIRAADAVMYTAKQAGRNRTEIGH
jgi:diguanylate cyclase (GGDEF)-like protein/PAS domain S-box-containing protein